jgi:hypothetical protein
MNKSIIFFIPLFNPRDILVEQYRSILDFGHSIVFYKNSKINDSLLRELKLFKNCFVSGNETNDGISISLNNTLTNFKEYDFLFFLDQDTIFNIYQFNIYFLNNHNVLTKQPLTYFYNSVKIPFLITNSGSLFNLKKFDLTINEKYYVEFIDYWIYLRLLSRNNKVLKIPINFIDHESNQNDVNSFIGFKVKSYTSSRIKEIIRNGFLLLKEVLFEMKFSTFSYKLKVVKTLILEILMSIFNFLFSSFLTSKNKVD